jgi:hypothetical protein
MSQATTSITTIPSRAPQAGTIYLLEIHHPNGNYFPETDLAACSMADVVEAIADGEFTQYQGVVRVLAMSIAASESWDASPAVAAAVLSRVLDRHQYVPEWCQDFLERHLGSHNIREAEAELRAA